ncbi:hypothetical protein FHR81_005524 [Actinoalloteichus hoggarensis]|uniref:Uncharacterized protein n=1 Tax=Actinoalloteichus hoggarensis TaxID=1470176 RepID=A0A221W583_9PSEU|nr:hypothetical protein [Actinoalloteichus hoggarensis]ASO20707.1 hypothetical protein AHOG_15405 [Actinoalloteichus hoggarensis]MBB5924439.1 hypothetical protein [Actinoalloteichus hoggarensis]
MYDLEAVVAAVSQAYGEDLGDAVANCEAADRLVDFVSAAAEEHDLDLGEVVATAELDEDEATWAASADRPAAVLINRIRDGLA